MEKQQTAVDWLHETFAKATKTELKDNVNLFFEQAKEMEKEQLHKYAEFAIRCDRKGMKILNFNDYIKL